MEHHLDHLFLQLRRQGFSLSSFIDIILFKMLYFIKDLKFIISEVYSLR